jgi:hypothetical protein
VNKTGYAKIAGLVEMPKTADMTQAEKYKSRDDSLRDETVDIDADENPLNTTNNP